MSIYTQIKDNVISGHASADYPYPPDQKGQPGVRELVRQALDEDRDVQEILNQGLIAGMEHVGAKFSAGEYYVPEMLLSARAMKTGLQLLEPLLAGGQAARAGTVIMGTVKGDMHDIGKNLVCMMLEGGGYQVIDLGIDTPPDKFVDAARDHPRAVVGMSALLTTTMGNMKTTLEALRAGGCQNRVIIGGAAVSQHYADEIRADGFTRDAAQVVPLVRELLKAGD